MASFESDGRMLIISFIGILIAVAMIGSIADEVFVVTRTLTVTNQTVTGPAANTTLDLQGRTLLTTVEVLNASNGTSMTLINAGGLLQTGFSSSGLRSVQLLLNDTGATGYEGLPINVSYIAHPDGYVPTAGGRSITTLITLFSALGILIFSVVMLWKGSISNLIKSKRAR